MWDSTSSLKLDISQEWYHMQDLGIINNLHIWGDLKIKCREELDKIKLECSEISLYVLRIII